MSYRVLLVAGVLAASVSGYCAAETIAIDGGIAVKESPVPTPTRGMTTPCGSRASMASAVPWNRRWGH